MSVSHIRHPHVDHKGKALCGRILGMTWHFQSLDHWLNSRMFGSRLVGCKQCLAVVTRQIKADA